MLLCVLLQLEDITKERISVGRVHVMVKCPSSQTVSHSPNDFSFCSVSV